MPVTCTPDGMAESIACLKEVNQQSLLAYMVYLLCLQTDMDCDPDTLDEAAKCLKGVPQQSLLAMAVAILCAIENGGGGGGSGVVSDGVVDPVAAPADPSVANWYINTAAGTAWLWPANGVAWSQII